MIVKPRLSYNPHPVGLYVHAGLVIGPWGECALKDVPPNARLYAHNDTKTFREVKGLCGGAMFFKKRHVRYKIHGRDIYSMYDVLARYSPEEAGESLRVYADWLAALKITPVALGTTARYLWETTVKRRLVIMSTRLPLPHESLIIGGRQESNPGVYDEATYWDIRGAYQSVMHELFVGRRYRHYAEKPHRYRLSQYRDCVGFARANIYFPEWKEMYGPLPLGEGRIASFPISGRMQGIFDLVELKLAAELGATIMVYEAWAGSGIRIPFNRWAELIESGKNLPNSGAAKIVKRMSNILWSTFAANGQKIWLDYSTGQLEKIPQMNILTPQCRALSAHVAASIRTRLFREALAFYGAGPYCISAHTDGAIFLPPAYPNGPIGNSLGKWRIKYEMQDVTLLSAQAFRFTDKKTGKLKHIIAGCPPQNSERIFSHMLRHAAERVDRRSSRLPGVLYSTETD